ncbi:MAG: glycoside hydrolase family 92 protein [Oleispira sp.]|nr:glycoside hydrolase family 92 protein [Oleispira sp.]
MKIIVVFFVVLLFGGCSNIKNVKTDPLKYVDPFICTEGDNGMLYPGPTFPFGLVHLSPETEGDSHVGYYYEDKYVEGFSHLRIGGAGSRGKGGGLLLKPGIGKFSNKIDEFKEKYNKSLEEASVGYYKTVLESGVKVELTVTERVGFHQYSFPEEAKKDRYVVVDLSHSYVGMLDASLNVLNNNEITGMIKSKHNNGGGNHQLYFAIVADTPFESYTSWQGDNFEDELAVRNGNDIGVWLRFPENGKNVVRLKVGMSPISEEQAMFEAKNEIKGFDFDNVRKQTASVWRDKLSKMEVKSDSEEFKTLFYTHLYHSYLVPNNATSSKGEYRAAHHLDTVCNTNSTAPDFTYYSCWSLWDDFRKYSMISILEPDVVKNIARSLVNYYGSRPDWITTANAGDGSWPTPTIRMEFASAVIMDAYNKGLGDFDTEIAFEGMLKDYEKYYTGNVSGKLEKAYHAYAALNMAESLGKTEYIEKLKAGADAYKNIWSKEQKDNQGNVRGFFTLDGNTVPDVEEFERYVYEGNLWHYRWFVLHDIEGLIDLRGSKEELSDDLEYFFENDFYMHLNEPDLHYPYLFNLLGKPYLTQKWIRTFTTKEVTQLYHNHGFFDEPVVKRIYRADPAGYIESMDDDAGTMSSWWVMSAMGLFQLDPVQPRYLIGSPIFPELTIHHDSGTKFKIIANNVSEDNFYIQSAKLNGQSYNKPWIEYSTVINGGTLEFEMGSEPNKQWGTAIN